MRFQVGSSSPTPRRRKAGAVMVAAALLVGGCKSTHLHTGSVPTDGYKTRHPIVVTEAAETLDVPVGSQTRSLSPELAETVASFARTARARGDGGMEILVPSGSANETAALYVARQIRHVVVRAGIPGDMVVAHTYGVDDPDALAPVRLSYLRLKAVTSRCGIWEEDMTSGLRNDGHSEFGCSTQSNLAAIVANPTDFLHPRPAKPGDAERRSVVFDKYRKGEATATEYDDEDKGVILSVGGG